MHLLVVPGIDGSSPEHWQSLWEAEEGDAASRIRPASWDRPDLEDWVASLDRAVERLADESVVLVAHSLGCLAVGAWLSRRARPVRGGFLVAPPDTRGPGFPVAAAPTFLDLAPEPLGVPGLVVYGDDDPYCSTEAATGLAAAWDVPAISAGRVGHINTDSRLGRWDAGRDLLTAFTAGTRPTTSKRPEPGLPSRP